MGDFWNDHAESEKKQFSIDLPVGTYKAEVIKCEVGKTKAGDDKIYWDLKITEPANYANNHHFIHSKYFPNAATDQEKTTTMQMLDFFRALDLPCRRDQLAESMKSVIGKTIEFKIAAGKNEGQFFTNFQRIVPAEPFPNGDGPF